MIENFRRMGLWIEQVRLVKGWFKDTVPAATVRQIAVLRLDGDLYESTIQVLDGFLSQTLTRLVTEAWMIMVPCLSCRAAVENYRRDHGMTERIVNIDGKGVL